MKKLITVIVAIVCVTGCNLQTEVLDTPLGENVLKDSTVNRSALAPVYAAYRDLYGDQSQMLNMDGISSDALIVPFRGGTDWFDGGRYIRMHIHSWTPTDVTVTSVWTKITKAIAKAAFAQKVIAEHPNQPNAKRYKAEAQAMGAYWNQVLLDLYGVAAFKDPSDVGKQNGHFSKIYRGKDAVNFILSQYSEAEQNLGTYNGVGTTHFTKAAVWAFKARLYLNKPVYVDEYAADFDFTKQDMDSVIYYTTKVINSGDYSLSNNYFAIWNVDNRNNPEIIFAFGQSVANDGSNRLAYFPASRAMHGSLTHLSAQGTDALALTTLAYHRWDGHHDDPRFFKANLPQQPGCIAASDYKLDRGIQVGQQYGLVLNSEGTGYQTCPNGDLKIDSLFDTPRSGKPVNYTIEVDLYNNNGQVNGVRPFKYEYDPESFTHDPSRVDLPMMRYADMWLMRAEAYLREGELNLALKDVNHLREIRGAKPATSIDLKRMFLERVWEFYYEFQSRRDQIRFGLFDDPWTDKTNQDPTRRLFPIPKNVVSAASVQEGYLTQNKGY